MDELQTDKQYYNIINKHLSFLNDVSLNANGDLTVKLITQTINRYSNSEFIKQCVAAIDEIAKNEYDFCKKLFEISCRLIEYRRDPDGHEMVWTPQLLLQVRQGDCKKFTTWICCVLKAKGIPSASKVVNYEKDYGWQHIYAIAFYPNEKGYLTIDPVNKKRWDIEVNYRVGRVNFYDGTYSKLIYMKLSMMGDVPNATFLGLGETASDICGDLDEISGRKRHKHIHKAAIHGIEEAYINGVYDDISGNDDGIGKKSPAKKAAVQKKRAEKKIVRKEKAKKIIKGAKKVGFTPVRAAFIALILAGKLLEKTPVKIHLAQKLAQAWMKDGGVAIKAIWSKFGGQPDALKKAIIKASGQQISGANISGIGVVAETTIAATIATAAPILASILKLLHDKKVITTDDAATAADVVETIEDNHTDANGNMDVKAAVEQSPQIVEEAHKIDAGGDQQAQAAIKNTTTPNDVSTPGNGATNNFPLIVNSGEAANQGKDGDAGGRMKASDSTDRSVNPQTMEDTTTNATSNTTHSGFNLMNGSSWINGALSVPLMGQTFENETIISISTVVSSFLLFGGVILIIKSYLK